MERDLVTPIDRLAPHTPLQRAIRYLRTQSKAGYCLDKPVKRLPLPQRTPSLLDRWLARRSA